MSNITTQQRIDEIQAIYREWLAVQQKLEQAQQDWHRSAELMAQLEDFYFNGEYQDIYTQIDDGLEVDLTTQGEYSVMSEDALWNAFHEQQNLLWQQLRFAVKHLDKNKPTDDE